MLYKNKNSVGERRLNILLDNISDAIITIDYKGIVLSVNNAVENIFGYHASEILGQNISMLMPKPYKEMHDSYLANYARTGQARIIGKSRAVDCQRKNGEVFTAELWVHKLNLEENNRHAIEFMGIIRDISEKAHVNQIKTEFISTVSHELRTPLTSIKGALSMLNSGVFGKLPDKASRMVTLAHNNTERLIRLVNDILDAEKIQAGKIDLNCVPLNITQLVQSSIESNESYATQCNTTLRFDNQSNDFWVYADEYRLQQVMANLISNAAKFSLENGVVDISIRKEHNIVKVFVKDGGLGIPEKYRPQIFQKFSQVDASDSRQKGGTGLGLNITKAIIEHHGGSIDYTTEEGKGSCFFFELAEYATSSEPSSVDSPFAIELSGIKANGHILILEDDLDIANLLSLLLQQHNFQVSHCTNTQQAKKLLQQHRFDAITVDLRLPGQNGLDFIKEMRQQELNNIPVIIISAEASLNHHQSNAKLSIIDWIDKPIDTKKLTRALRQALKKPSKEIKEVLYIEDNQDVIDIMKTLLPNNINLSQANNLQDAKEKIERSRFDLIILDITLPDGSGLSLIPFIHQHSLIPIIIFSAQEVEKNITNQVDAVLIKSQADNEELVNTIKTLISNNNT